jgi:hypothetical protein
MLDGGTFPLNRVVGYFSVKTGIGHKVIYSYIAELNDFGMISLIGDKVKLIYDEQALDDFFGTREAWQEKPEPKTAKQK